MDISFTDRLSFKQASLTVLVAFILGTLLSLIQVGVDYASEDASIDREMQTLLEIAHNPAARIAYNIDAELAQELVEGLLQSPAVIRAEIIDNDGVTLASVSRTPHVDGYRLFSDMLFGEHRGFESTLFVDHDPGENLGLLRLQVDTYAFGDHFLRRSLITLLSGFARSLLLSLILLVMFYAMLTKPLVGLARALSTRDPRDPHQRLELPAGHEHDEIGVLVHAINQQLQLTSAEIEQRREAENRLTQYLGELEDIVSARTAEVEAANARLMASNRDLQAAKRTAQETAQARAAFLAHMSHEIRTPLNGLLGMLSLSMDGPLGTEQRQQLSIAHDSGKVLVELLNDILDLSKFEAGQLELERIPFDLGSLVEDTASLLSQNASPGVELTCLISPGLPSQLLGDPTRVRQIVSNLLSNALKFTRTGRVDVKVRPSANGVCIIVRDTGIGIPPAAQARIFHPFAQGGAGITRQYGGTGLGLALARRLCEAMQGELELDSREGQGSQFIVDLPLPAHQLAAPVHRMTGRVVAQIAADSGLDELLDTWLPAFGLKYWRQDPSQSLSGTKVDLLISDRAENLLGLRAETSAPLLLITAYGNFLPTEETAHLAPLEQLARPLSRAALAQSLSRLLGQEPTNVDPQQREEKPLRRARVLLVEDNAVNQLVAKGMLGKLGCEVAVTGHGAEALAYLEEQDVDLVLMDCNMPVMDGYEASRRIRRDGRWADLPIIALTANALPDERERCRSCGMNDYLAKPFRREELAAMLDTWFSPSAH
ncbi:MULTISPECIES: hybrid sensor histidine kinase/response regulator [Pseudomonas]|uniref:hybrid sensor histidine kinase/response regulator n=1 Tax=Pseudomonas TaxID=286 RepID=UPI00258046F9|nr:MULTISPECIES: ATP-binding protein [Pseudomonas]